MKIDHELIESFKQLGLYQSKAAIAGYAEESFGLKIQRNLSFENMVKKLEDHVGTFEQVGVVEAPKTGFKLDVTAEDTELEEALLFSEPTIVDVVEPEKRVTTINVPEGVSTKDYLERVQVELMARGVSKSNDRKAELMALLPPDFKPCFNPMGDIEAFYPLSYWINDWITETENWQFRINEYPRVQEHKFLYTLVYYIAVHGKFMIRETRNGQYVTLS